MAKKSAVQNKVTGYNGGLSSNAVSSMSNVANPEMDLTKNWFNNSTYFTPTNIANTAVDPEIDFTKHLSSKGKFSDYFTPTNSATTPTSDVAPVVTTPTSNSTPTLTGFGKMYVDMGLGDENKWNGMTGTEQAALVPFLTKNNESGFLSSVGGTQGLASILGGIGQIGSFWNGMEQNRRAEKEWDMRNTEINRQKQRDVDFANAINKSGLGSYSAGIK